MAILWKLSALWEVVELIPTKEEWIEALAKRHGAETQKRFQNATVAICGLGGLGSNIAIALTRAGIGRLILIDFDQVDLTNLHRQQYNISQIEMFKTEALAANLRQINPYIELEDITVRITEENAELLLKNADIICEAFDDAKAKAMLTDLVLERLPEKYLIASSGMAGFKDANAIQTRKITEHFYICGDMVSDVTDVIGLVASRVMICAAHQAHKVLQILWKEGKTNEQ